MSERTTITLFFTGFLAVVAVFGWFSSQQIPHAKAHQSQQVQQ